VPCPTAVGRGALPRCPAAVPCRGALPCRGGTRCPAAVPCPAAVGRGALPCRVTTSVATAAPAMFLVAQNAPAVCAPMHVCTLSQLRPRLPCGLLRPLRAPPQTRFCACAALAACAALRAGRQQLWHQRRHGRCGGHEGPGNLGAPGRQGA